MSVQLGTTGEAASVQRSRKYERYVALGDSSTEGLEDPRGDGGYRGWADRLALHVARSQGSLMYANLAIRGRDTRQILEEQLEPALAMRPDLATLFAGTNDAVARDFDVQDVGLAIGEMQARLIEVGATVLTFTLPDLTEVMPLGRYVAERVLRLNDELRRVADSTGAILVDFAADLRATDPRLWSDDGFHANSLGHRAIATALANAIGVPGDEDWASELGVPKGGALARRTGRVIREASWYGRFFLPWLWRHLRGRSTGDHRTAKRPRLVEVVDEVTEPGSFHHTSPASGEVW